MRLLLFPPGRIIVVRLAIERWLEQDVLVFLESVKGGVAGFGR